MSSCSSFRIGKDHGEYLWEELKQGRLRLAARRSVIFDGVKRSDRILVLHPMSSECALVEAPKDFDKGYRFEVSPETGDHGHIFPVTVLKVFDRHAPTVSDTVRTTLKVPRRFWNISRHADDIRRILDADPADCRGPETRKA